MGNTQEKPENLERFERVVGVIIFFILFITVLVYAGERGHYAYVHKPALQTNFIASSSVQFPAFTFCPLIPGVTVNSIFCYKEIKMQPVANCGGTTTTRSFIFEGLSRNCITFNEASPFSSNALEEEIGLRVFFNSTMVPVDEPFGCLVLVHPQGQEPVLTVTSTFTADVGKLTEGWIRKETTNYLTGTTQDSFTVVTSAVTSKITDLDPTTIIDVDLQYAEQGYYLSQEYYVYTTYNWFGEVGGFACLLLFLYWAVMGIIDFIASRLPPFKRRSESAPFTSMNDR